MIESWVFVDDRSIDGTKVGGAGCQYLQWRADGAMERWEDLWR
jgi:hypothetical protein